MITKAIKIRADVFTYADPAVPADVAAIENISKFIDAIEQAAKMYLPGSRTLLKIKELRDTERRI